MVAASGRPAAPPSKVLAATELPRALFELGTLPFSMPLLMQAPRGDGHSVLVLPGFVTTDTSTRPLRSFLASLGYQTHGWNLGRNLGPKAIGSDGERLVARLDEIVAQSHGPVSLIGWSLGGVMARQLSRRRPECVRQIITLGSPITGDPRATNAWRAYEMMSGQKIKSASTQELLRESKLAPPVPSTAIYSKRDGIVAWRSCLEPETDRTDNIEVYGSHCGLGVNPVVLYAIADRLAQAENEWRPFSRRGFRSVFYPSSGHIH